jgi:hypothetical protein
MFVTIVYITITVLDINHRHVFHAQRFGDWILFPSSVGNYSDVSRLTDVSFKLNNKNTITLQAKFLICFRQIPVIT